MGGGGGGGEDLIHSKVKITKLAISEQKYKVNRKYTGFFPTVDEVFIKSASQVRIGQAWCVVVETSVTTFRLYFGYICGDFVSIFLVLI